MVMMKIRTRRVGKYVEVTVNYCGSTVDSGFLAEEEARNLAEHLREIADELEMTFNKGEE